MQTVPALFNDFANGQVRPLTWQLRISFDKQFDDSITFFTLDESVLDGGDVLAPSDDNPLQEWDYYEYLPFTDRVQMIEWSREIEFPNSVTAAMADFTLENHDDYFTPGAGSPINQYILPKRPLRILSGFKDMSIPQFVGLTEKMPVVDDTSKTASFHAMDFLSKIYTMPISETLAAQDIRTDEVLAMILEQFGMTPEQYSLDKGSNKIPFLFFDKDVAAGDVLRKLMQAEMGNLWLDEEGIIQFDQRVVLAQDPVYTFNESNTVSISTTRDDNIINKVVINAEIREVQAYQPVFLKSISDTDTFVVIAGESRTFEASLEDPAIDIQEPTIGIGSSASFFTASDISGNNVSSSVAVTDTELRTNSYLVTFQNTNAFDININQMELWGAPAKVIDRIEYTEVDQGSIDKYEEHILEIDNNFIQSIDQCDSLALSILDEFSEYANQIEIVVKGNPALQLNDIISVKVKTYDGTYRIIKIANKLSSGQYTQIITARKYTPHDWFILDQSLLDGPAVLTP